MTVPSSRRASDHTGLCVAVVEDNPVYRRGLRRLLARTRGIGRVWAWDGRGDAAAQVAACRPDVVLLDLREGGQERLDRVARVRTACPEARILVLTGVDRPGLLEAVRAAGGDDCLTKDVPDAVLVAWVLG